MFFFSCFIVDGKILLELVLEECVQVIISFVEVLRHNILSPSLLSLAKDAKLFHSGVFRHSSDTQNLLGELGERHKEAIKCMVCVAHDKNRVVLDLLGWRLLVTRLLLWCLIPPLRWLLRLRFTLYILPLWLLILSV
jgi:hypothetical protein